MPRGRGGLALTARALRWRRGSTLTLLAVATVTTAAAALGPIYARAAGESTLRDTLQRANADQSGLSFHAEADGSSPSVIDDVEGTLPALGSVVGYDRRNAELSKRAAATPEGRRDAVNTVVSFVQGACSHLVLVSGRCPQGAGEAMVSERSLQGGYGFRLGGTLSTTGIDVDRMNEVGETEQVPATLSVVGVYRPVDPADPFWFGRNHFSGHLYDGRGDGPDTVDDVFVAQPTFTGLTRPSQVDLYVDYPLDPTRVSLDGQDALGAAVAGLVAQHGPDADIQLKTQLAAVLAQADHERELLDVSTVLVTLQLALLAWLVLFQVVGDAAESRGNEIALAKLRGLSPRATLTFGLGEPFLVLVLAVPLGLLAGWLAVDLLARAVLLPGTPVTLTWGAVLGALAGFAGAAVGAALAARRVLTRPVLEQWRRVPENTQPGAASLVVDLVLVVVAVLGLVALRASATGTEPRPVSLLAPGLLVLAVALLGVRLLPLAGRSALGPTRASARIGAFLAVRQVVRRPAGMRLAALLAVAIGLATFAIDGEAVASTNRTTRAGLEVGAAQVVHAQYQLGHDPVDVARAVDPDGTWALGAATWITNGGPVTGTVVAVDSTRLAAVANWAAGDAIGVDEAASLVGPSLRAPLDVRADALRVTVQRLASSGAPPRVSFLVQPTGKRAELVRAGPLVEGTQPYTATVPCAGGCRLQSIVLDRPSGYLDPLAGSVVIKSVEQRAGGAWKPFDAKLGVAGEWRAGGTPRTAQDQLTPTAEGLRDDYSSDGGAVNAIGHADSPVPIPVLSTPQGVGRESAGDPVMVDKTGSSTPFTDAGEVALIPRALDNGALVDVRYIRQQLVDFDNEADWQVWLSASAPADAVDRLRAGGLLVGTVETQADRTGALARQGPALALLLLVACAVVGALLAAGATALAVAVTGRRRSFELAALSVVGVPRRSLLRSCTGEQLILLGTGLLLGLPSGILAARLALPAIPQYSDVSAVPLDFEPHVATLALFAAIVAALLVVVALVAARALMRSAVPTRLREAEQ